ncbi:ABC transporter ATP-binding protein [Hydrogenibacillus schlegelii]
MAHFMSPGPSVFTHDTGHDLLSAGSISLENRNFDKMLNKEREAYFNQQKQIDHSHLITQLWMTLGTVAVVAAGFTLRPGGSFDASLVLILIYSAFHLAGFGKRFLAFLELLGRLDVSLRKIGYGDPPRIRPVQVVSLPDPVIIAVEDVSFSYKEGEPVLQQVFFDIRQREKLLIVGKNGSGKSTLVKLIAGLLNPDQGRVLYNRKYLHGAADIGYYSQHMELFDRSIYENMIYPRESCDIGAIWRLVDLLKLNTLIEDEEDLFHKRPGDFGARFSGGEKQKLLIARSLMNKKPVMIYDEVNSALDREAVEIFANLIENELQSSTVILVSHRIEGICGFERVVEISDGRLSLVS